MHRVFIEPALSAGELIELSERESHHLGRVLRVREAERVEGLDGAGHRLALVVHSLSKKSVILRVEQRQTVPELAAHITLFQAIPKGKNMEWIVEKATELGVQRIVPVLTDRTAMRPDASDRTQKVEKWTATAIDAIKQCGSAWLPRIEAPMTLSAALALAGATDLSLLGTFAEDARHPRRVIEEFSCSHGRRPKSFGVWIGPEGDFTGPELAAIRAIGAQPITLGPLVLRAETAALYALSVLNYETLS